MQVSIRSRDGVSCRICGAAQARPSENRFGVCGNCFNKIEAKNDWPDEVTDEQFVAYLAGALAWQSKRHSKGLPIIRCEALTEEFNSSGMGYQCGQIGLFTRDGRHVCKTHAQRNGVRFVGERSRPCGPLIGILEELCERDADFFAAVESVVTRLYSHHQRNR